MERDNGSQDRRLTVKYKKLMTLLKKLDVKI